jgi:hypothetical protein
MTIRHSLSRGRRNIDYLHGVEGILRAWGIALKIEGKKKFP